MLNENKVKMMTKMAIYEKHEGRTMQRNAKYYKSDFVALGVLKTIISVTIAYIVLVVLLAVCKADWLVANINHLDYVTMGKTVAVSYVIFLIVFAVIAGIVYSKKYDSSRKEMKRFFSRLNKLERFYDGRKKKS